MKCRGLSFNKKKKELNNLDILIILTRRNVSLRNLLVAPGVFDVLSSLLFDSVLIAGTDSGDGHVELFSCVEISVRLVVKGVCRPKICLRSISAE